MKKKRTMSVHETIVRGYKWDMKRFKKWCEKNDIPYYTFKDAPNDSLCALSMNEYDLGELREDLEIDSESLFLEENDYNTYNDR